MSSLKSTVHAVEAHLMGCREAINLLSVIGRVPEMLNLCRTYFPEDFAKAHLNWLDVYSVLNACSKFMRLVDTHLFPIRSTLDDIDLTDINLTDIEFSEYINVDWIITYAPYPDWWDMDGEDMSPLQRTILTAAGEINQKGEMIVYQMNSPRRSLDLDLLEWFSSQGDGQLQPLIDAVKFTLRLTDNFWCDLSEEEAGNLGDFSEWCESNIDWLAEEWRAAQEIHQKFRDLENWMLGQMPQRQWVIWRLIERTLTTEERPPERGEGIPHQITLAEILNQGGDGMPLQITLAEILNQEG